MSQYRRPLPPGLTDQQRTEFQEAFDMFDLNRNGTISGNEIKSVLRSMGQNPTEQQIREMLGQKNPDEPLREIDFSEFVHVATAPFADETTQPAAKAAPGPAPAAPPASTAAAPDAPQGAVDKFKAQIAALTGGCFAGVMYNPKVLGCYNGVAAKLGKPPLEPPRDEPDPVPIEVVAVEEAVSEGQALPGEDLLAEAVGVEPPTPELPGVKDRLASALLSMPQNEVRGSVASFAPSGAAISSKWQQAARTYGKKAPSNDAKRLGFAPGDHRTSSRASGSRSRFRDPESARRESQQSRPRSDSLDSTQRPQKKKEMQIWNAVAQSVKATHEEKVALRKEAKRKQQEQALAPLTRTQQLDLATLAEGVLIHSQTVQRIARVLSASPTEILQEYRAVKQQHLDETDFLTREQIEQIDRELQQLKQRQPGLLGKEGAPSLTAELAKAREQLGLAGPEPEEETGRWNISLGELHQRIQDFREEAEPAPVRPPGARHAKHVLRSAQRLKHVEERQRLSLDQLSTRLEEPPAPPAAPQLTQEELGVARSRWQQALGLQPDSDDELELAMAGRRSMGFGDWMDNFFLSNKPAFLQVKAVYDDND